MNIIDNISYMSEFIIIYEYFGNHIWTCTYDTHIWLLTYDLPYMIYRIWFTVYDLFTAYDFKGQITYEHRNHIREIIKITYGAHMWSEIIYVRSHMMFTYDLHMWTFVVTVYDCPYMMLTYDLVTSSYTGSHMNIYDRIWFPVYQDFTVYEVHMSAFPQERSPVRVMWQNCDKLWKSFIIDIYH